MAAQFFLPLFNNLTQATCLVVGGGTTALRKIRWLVKAGATIKVVTPELCDELKEMEQAGLISVSMDVFRPVYVHKKLRFVISATNVSAVNRTVYEAAMAAHVPVNCVDAPALCTVVFPAIVDRFPIVVAISSMGVAPTLSRVVRGWLEARLPAQLPALAELADSLRDRVKSNLWQLNFFYRSSTT